MELYRSRLVRLMDAAAVAGSAHSASPAKTKYSLGDVLGPHSGNVTLVIFTSQHEHNFQTCKFLNSKS
jgi:hypothetical protein